MTVEDADSAGHVHDRLPECGVVLAWTGESEDLERISQITMSVKNSGDDATGNVGIAISVPEGATLPDKLEETYIISGSSSHSDPELVHLARRSPFLRTIVVARWTEVYGDISSLFGLLDEFEFLVPLAWAQDGLSKNEIQMLGVDASSDLHVFPFLDCTVVGFRKCARLSRTLAAWSLAWRQVSQAMDGHYLHPADLESKDADATACSLRMTLRSGQAIKWTFVSPNLAYRYDKPGILFDIPAAGRKRELKILPGNNDNQVLNKELYPESRTFPNENGENSTIQVIRNALIGRDALVAIGSLLLAERSGMVEIVDATLGKVSHKSASEGLWHPDVELDDDQDISTLKAPRSTVSEISVKQPNKPLRSDTLIYVVGMHRSGTSAITESIFTAGLTIVGKDNLIGADASNPRGHFESQLVCQVNDQVLSALGGSWYRPPRLQPTWEQDRGLQSLHEPMRTLVTALTPYPGPAVWKDPRFCITLPLWRDAIGGPNAAVLVYRDPREVTSSLAHRDNMHPSQGAALWERYNRAAMTNLDGMPVLVVRYDDALNDSHSWAVTLRRFLLDCGVVDIRPDLEDAVFDVLDPALRHEQVGARMDDHYANASKRSAEVGNMLHDDVELSGTPLTASGGLFSTQAAIMDELDALRGIHMKWRIPDLPPEGPWVEGMLQWSP